MDSRENLQPACFASQALRTPYWVIEVSPRFAVGITPAAVRLLHILEKVQQVIDLAGIGVGSSVARKMTDTPAV